MSLARLVWLVGGASAVLVAGAAGLGACSSTPSTGGSSDGGGTVIPTDTGTAVDTGPAVITDAGTDTGTIVDSGGGADASDGATCEKPPSLFPETTPGVYCPFSAPASGGSDITCTAGQHCCEVPVGATTPSTCVANGTACPVANSTDWQCEAPIDCTSLDAGTPVCCGTGTATTATHCGITWPEWNAFTGTKCMASCPAPGITVCETNGDCTTDAGPTCTGSKAAGNDFGFCN